ncbi:hypothetical protein [Vulcaniibacterium tengchongense]|uniref:Uncharacterized protein n=1 Tax=Vulcaniibacterium tengchongense TaxID=1273429 RepID=A0A3N4VW93_9GAMM|nr:hypothetical protein [Vulcaniibacterium tengchongense]RPE81327.1 hypothetical protein EDC50_0512 [Vulcaniibacterium tengchongense]
MFWILGGVAVLVASRLASGAWVLPLAFAIWIGLVLLMALAGALLPTRKPVRAAAAPSPPWTARGGAAEPLAEPQARLLPPVTGIAPAQAPLPHPEPDGHAWYRLLDETGIHFNERWPRADICSTREFFLRKGDRLLLRYVPAGTSDRDWYCDIHGRWRGGELPLQRFRVEAERPHRLAIPEDGLYEIGIAQGAPDGSAQGTVSIWLEADSPDRLALGCEPQCESRANWRRVDGEWRVEIEHEAHALDRAKMPVAEVHAVPAGAVVLFDPQVQAWDETSIADPHLDWERDRRHLYRHYLQLSRGDVVAVEYAWQASRFGAEFAVPGGTGLSDGQLELSQFVRGPTVLQAHSGWDGGEAGCRRVVLATVPDSGFYQVDLSLSGPASWRGRPSADFVQLRVWGALLRRPQAVRDFALVHGRVHDWYRRLLPLPRELERGPAGEGRRAS